MVDKLISLYWESNGSYVDNDVCDKMFIEGRALFRPSVFQSCMYMYANMEDNYLVLPYPLWDDDQEKYPGAESHVLFEYSKKVHISDSMQGILRICL